MEKISSLSPVLLAYLGDAVFELNVRLKLLDQGAIPIRKLHRWATLFTRASGQAQLLEILQPHLTDEEADIVRRGRNSKTRVPKNAEVSDYRRATGLEALFGYLYLQNKEERLQQLFDIIDFKEEENSESDSAGPHS